MEYIGFHLCRELPSASSVSAFRKNQYSPHETAQLAYDGLTSHACDKPPIFQYTGGTARRAERRTIDEPVKKPRNLYHPDNSCNISVLKYSASVSDDKKDLIIEDSAGFPVNYIYIADLAENHLKSPARLA